MKGGARRATAAEVGAALLAAVEAEERGAATAWRPNPGPQAAFMACDAFELLYGGQVGGGKSEALLQKALHGVHDRRYCAILFRRSFPDLERSLIARSQQSYRAAYPRAEYNSTKHLWTFPSGARIYFSHLEHDKSVYDHQSAEYAFIGFDELTQFTKWQYTYMLTRARTSFGMRPLIRAATNPGGEGHEWVFQRWAPWLDPKAARRAEPGGVLSYRSTVEGEEWSEDGKLSRVFIPAQLADTPQLRDTNYAEQLGALDPVTRAQLLEGNWLVKAAAGAYFKRAWFNFVEPSAVPRTAARIRYWDRAATVDGDWTVGARVALADGHAYIEDIYRFRGRPHDVEAAIGATAEADGRGVAIGIEEDPGSAGKFESSYYIRKLGGWNVRAFRVRRDKVTRAQPFSAQCEGRNVSVVRGGWNAAMLQELEEFPDGGNDDQVDALSGAYAALVTAPRLAKRDFSVWTD